MFHEYGIDLEGKMWLSSVVQISLETIASFFSQVNATVTGLTHTHPSFCCAVAKADILVV